MKKFILAASALSLSLLCSCGIFKDKKAEAFEYCESVETVIIGRECEKIGSSAFAYCEKLADVWLTENVAYIDNRSFEYCAPNLTLHVPTGSYAEEYAISNNIPFDNAIN